MKWIVMFPLFLIGAVLFIVATILMILSSWIMPSKYERALNFNVIKATADPSVPMWVLKTRPIARWVIGTASGVAGCLMLFRCVAYDWTDQFLIRSHVMEAGIAILIIITAVHLMPGRGNDGQ